MTVKIGEKLRKVGTVVKLWGYSKPMTVATIKICPANIAELHELGYSHMNTGHGWEPLPEVLT